MLLPDNKISMFSGAYKTIFLHTLMLALDKLLT